MVDYIISTHNYYTEIALPTVEEKILRLMEHSKLSEKEVSLVINFFNDYKKDFLTHISQEEEHILPYVLELERQSGLDEPDSQFIKKLRSYSISEFEKEHDRLEISLKHLSELIIKYLPSPEQCRLTGRNAFFCSPGSGSTYSTTQLFATAHSVTANPYCHWSCWCGTGAPPHVTIDGSDGLPVELMGFSVE